MDLQHFFSPSGLPRGKWTLVKIEHCDDSQDGLLHKDIASLAPGMEIWNSNSAWYSSPGIKIVEVGEGFVTFTHPMIRSVITLHPGERMRTNEYQVAPYEYGYTHIELLAGRYSHDKISKRPWKESFDVPELDTSASLQD